jgi:copper chaperone CopZ
MREVVLKVKGMDCPDCAVGIESKFKELKGVKNYNFLFSSEK